MKLFTVGYEGCDIQEFVEFLYSKKIEYIHFPALGVPSAWRKKLKKS